MEKAGQEVRGEGIEEELGGRRTLERRILRFGVAINSHHSRLDKFADLPVDGFDEDVEGL
jgi:hypothetical protein